MAVYNREDLLFHDYEWAVTATHVKLQGAPDRNLFTNSEGYEVLYMINYTCEILECTSKSEAGRMEMLLHEKLPLEIRSQNSVFIWLQKEYNLVLNNS